MSLTDSELRKEPDKEQLGKLLAENYFDATSTIRHYDSLRATFSSLSLSALALLGGFSAAQMKGGSPETIRALAIVGLLLALLSILTVIKLSYLIERQRLRARVSIRLLEECTGGPAISLVDREVRETSKTWVTSSLSLNSLWTGFFVALFLLFALAALFSHRLIIQ
jgi:hypothetical protein